METCTLYRFWYEADGTLQKEEFPGVARMPKDAASGRTDPDDLFVVHGFEAAGATRLVVRQNALGQAGGYSFGGASAGWKPDDPSSPSKAVSYLSLEDDPVAAGAAIQDALRARQRYHDQESLRVAERLKAIAIRETISKGGNDHADVPHARAHA